MSCGHPRSLEHIIDACNTARVDRIEKVVGKAGASLAKAYPSILWHDVVKLTLLGEPLPLSYQLPDSMETIESLIESIKGYC